MSVSILIGDVRDRLRELPPGGRLKPKDLCMVPNRLAIALQEAGWWVRSEIIWAKSNPMPESINDRPATSHEKIFLNPAYAEIARNRIASEQGMFANVGVEHPSIFEDAA